MVKLTSQGCFNRAINMLMVVFELSYEEALDEAITQFEAEGFDLTNIVKCVALVNRRSSIPVLLYQINTAKDEITFYLKELRKSLKRGMAYKIMGGRCGAYNLLIEKIKNHDNNKAIVRAIVNVLTVLMDGYPDFIDVREVEYIIETLKKCNFENSESFLMWACKCCAVHQLNRELFIEKGVIGVLKLYIQSSTPKCVLKQAWELINCLTLDGDMISDTLKCACDLSSALLKPLNSCLPDFSDDRKSLRLILRTIFLLVVRKEHCEILANEGGLENIRNCLDKHFDDKKLYQEAFKVLSALAGNDAVKAKIIQSGFGPYITSSMARNSDNLAFCIDACHLIASLCIHNEENSKILISLGCHEQLVHNMKQHLFVCELQATSCHALRNMVSNHPEFKELLKHRIQGSFKDYLLQHEECSEQIKFILRELSCDIVPNEPLPKENEDELK